MSRAQGTNWASWQRQVGGISASWANRWLRSWLGFWQRPKIRPRSWGTNIYRPVYSFIDPLMVHRINIYKDVAQILGSADMLRLEHKQLWIRLSAGLISKANDLPDLSSLVKLSWQLLTTNIGEDDIVSEMVQGGVLGRIEDVIKPRCGRKGRSDTMGSVSSGPCQWGCFCWDKCDWNHMMRYSSKNQLVAPSGGDKTTRYVSLQLLLDSWPMNMGHQFLQFPISSCRKHFMLLATLRCVKCQREREM